MTPKAFAIWWQIQWMTKGEYTASNANPVVLAASEGWPTDYETWKEEAGTYSAYGHEFYPPCLGMTLAMAEESGMTKKDPEALWQAVKPAYLWDMYVLEGEEEEALSKVAWYEENFPNLIALGEEVKPAVEGLKDLGKGAMSGLGSLFKTAGLALKYWPVTAAVYLYFTMRR